MSNVKNRKSIRKFTEELVSKELLVDIVEAGLSAPSSKNKRPFQFIVVQGDTLIQKFSEVHANWKLLSGTKQFIIVCGDLAADERVPHMLMATSAATENISIRCTELGLGSVWVGCYPDETRLNYIKQTFDLEETLVPVSVVAIGYPQSMNTKERVYDMSKVRFY